MTTTQETTDTKEKLVQVAIKLLIEKGYAATSVDSICEAAGVTKGAFFHYFKSKDAITEEAVRHYTSTMNANLGACCDQSLTDPLERIYNMLDAMIEVTARPEMKGCLVGTLSQEIQGLDSRLREVCCESFDGMRKMLERDFVLAKKQYAPKAKFDPRSLAEQLIATGQGSMLMAKATKDKGIMKRAFSQYKDYVKFLFE
jgi:TetR/AcrR family transcriptional regulator, transcriptional repressor for nem operon